MWPDRVSNPGALTYKSGALPIALRGPANTPFLGEKHMTCGVYGGVFLCCPFSHEVSWMRS